MNGTLLDAQQEQDAAGAGATIQNISTLVALQPGHYVELGVHQTGANTITLPPNDDSRSYFSMHWVGPAELTP